MCVLSDGAICRENVAFLVERIPSLTVQYRDYSDCACASSSVVVVSTAEPAELIERGNILRRFHLPQFQQRKDAVCNGPYTAKQQTTKETAIFALFHSFDVVAIDTAWQLHAPPPPLRLFLVLVMLLLWRLVSW